MYTDVVLDLETLGTAPGSVILSIGAVMVDERDTELTPAHPRFHQHIRVQDSVAAGLTMDPSTVLWWLGQSIEAREALRAGQVGAESLPSVLEGFGAWVRNNADTRSVRVWGNGSDFDNTLLTEAYRAAAVPVPWKFWNNRCLRTLMAEHPEVARVKPALAHDALSDAEAQAATLIAIRCARGCVS